jgi:ATP-dependent Clp protease ATP-binding subunit ClpX
MSGHELAPEDISCSFCGKTRSEVANMVCGPTPDIAICDECVALVVEIMAENEAGPASDAAT